MNIIFYGISYIFCIKLFILKYYKNEIEKYKLYERHFSYIIFLFSNLIYQVEQDYIDT